MIRNLAGKKIYKNKPRRHSKTEKCGIWDKKISLGGLNSIMVMVQEERFSEHEGRPIEIIQSEK